MYQKKAFNRREQDYAMGLRRKLEEAEAMLQHLAPSRARSLALTKLDEALLWANVGIAEAGLQQGYTAAPRNRGFDFDDALATNVDGQQVRATRARDITFDGMKVAPRRDENQDVAAQKAAPSAAGDLVLLKPGQVAIDAGRLTKLVEQRAQKEAATGTDSVNHVLDRLTAMNSMPGLGYDVPIASNLEDLQEYMRERQEYMRAMAKVRYDYEVWKKSLAEHEEESK